jgi:hypothetical protein
MNMGQFNYLPEVRVGQKYNIEGEIFELFDIRATNVTSSKDYIIACRFRSENNFFEERLQVVIEDPVFELILKDNG